MIRYSPGIREKLIGIFILIKVIPLVVLAWFGWEAIISLTATLEKQVGNMVSESHDVVEQVGSLSVDNSIKALDIKSREAIERLTTDTARVVAAFLYDRDQDIENAASLPPSEANYRIFLNSRIRPIIEHEPWVMDEDGKTWVPSKSPKNSAGTRTAQNEDNKKDFHYRPSEVSGRQINRPLFREMTYVNLEGREIVKVTTSDLMTDTLQDVSK
jgi:two-component system, cell cycle sensor histidine kinase and response regulator CckA